MIKQGSAGETAEDRPTIGISACLLGQNVRYDGGHKRSRAITDSWGPHFHFHPLCPEVAIGLGTPRKPIRLVGSPGAARAVGVLNAEFDVTTRLREYADSVIPSLAGLSGYILKKNSPSCGMERVRIYPPGDGPPSLTGSGIFANELLSACPALPVEEEGRLMDRGLRENFVERVFTLHRWHRTMAAGLTAARLVNFHTRHKFLLLAHSEPVYRELGPLVATAGDSNIGDLAQRYLVLLMRGLKQKATPAKHANVLMHIMGFFKDSLDQSDKRELLDAIAGQRLGRVPLIVPVTLINHYQRRYPSDYIGDQVYLEPHPWEVALHF